MTGMAQKYEHYLTSSRRAEHNTIHNITMHILPRVLSPACGRGTHASYHTAGNFNYTVIGGMPTPLMTLTQITRVRDAPPSHQLVHQLVHRRMRIALLLFMQKLASKRGMGLRHRLAASHSWTASRLSRRVWLSQYQLAHK